MVHCVVKLGINEIRLEATVVYMRKRCKIRSRCGRAPCAKAYSKLIKRKWGFLWNMIYFAETRKLTYFGHCVRHDIRHESRKILHAYMHT